jgi:CubicO group peptidase (beta-lactamase class C family)
MDKTAITSAIKASVDAGELAGAVALVWRDGQVRHTVNVGWQDIESRLPVETDTLFRIASMTKPITSTVALILLEEGRFKLDEPIARFAPEFSQMRVLRSPDGPLDETDPAERQITFEDLLTHRSGLTYGPFHNGPIAKAYANALGGDIDSAVAPDDWITRLAALPLIDQPGATFHYGCSTDLLGLLIARIEDAPLGDVFERRIFSPLSMKDTGFTLSHAQQSRAAKAYGFDDVGRLMERLAGPGGSFLADRPQDMTYVSGGQGLWSTLGDYLAFARMFLGEAHHVQLLRPETLALMTTNRLTQQQRSTGEVGGLPLFAAGHGFGLGIAVVTEPEKALPALCGGSAGAVGWPGGFGGWWQADPNDGSILIFLTHNMVERDQFAKGVGFGVYGAIMRFQALAMES